MTRVLVSMGLLLGLVAVAEADVISMAEEDCIDKAQGAACEGEEGRGTCQTGECCRLDYNQMPPQEACTECLVCKPGGGGDDDGCDASAAGGPMGPAVMGLGVALALGLRRRRR